MTVIFSSLVRLRRISVPSFVHIYHIPHIPFCFEPAAVKLEGKCVSPHESVKKFFPSFEHFFPNSDVSISSFFIAPFKFCAFLGVMKTQLMCTCTLYSRWSLLTPSCPPPTEQASAGTLSTTCWPRGSGG